MKLPNLPMMIKQESIFSQKFGSRDFWRIVNNVLNTSKLIYLLCYNCPKVLSSVSNKAKLVSEDFSKNSNLDDSG